MKDESNLCTFKLFLLLNQNTAVSCKKTNLKTITKQKNNHIYKQVSKKKIGNKNLNVQKKKWKQALFGRTKE